MNISSKMLELRRAEPMNVDVRIFSPDVMEELEVPIQTELRMMPALHQNLHATRRGESHPVFGRTVRV